MKKLISLILSFLMLTSLVSCVPEEKVQENTDKSALLSGTLENGGRWFYAEMAYSNMVNPLDGTYEKERAESVYINDTLINGEKRPNFSSGTIVKIKYDGEMLLPSGQKYPIISSVYSVSLELYPFVTSEGTYLISCIQTQFDREEAEELCINRKNGDEHFHAPFLLKAKSAKELRDLYLKTLPSFYKKDYLERYDSQFSYYTDEFFKDNILLLAFFSSSSGGDRYKLSSITLTNGVFTIDIAQTQSGQTCDVSEWLFCVAVPRNIDKKVNAYEAVNGWEK